MFVPSFIALSMSSALATPSWSKLNASFIIGTRSRFTTKPGDSFTSTASLPSFVHRSLIRAAVASLVSEPSDLREDAVHLRRRHLPFLDALCEWLSDPSETAVHEALLDVPHRDLETRGGARLRDPGAHRPRPNHSDLSHLVHAHRTTRRARNIRADLKNALRS